MRFIALILCLGFAGPVVASAATVFCPLTIVPGAFLVIQPPQLAVATGERFSVDVAICNASNVIADFLNFRFTSSIIEATGVTEGEFLKRRGPTVFLQGTIDANSGTITAVEDNLIPFLPPAGVSGTGTLVTLNFVALAPGTSRIEMFSSGIRETTGAETPPALGATVMVISEPATVILAGSTFLLWGVGLGCRNQSRRRLKEDRIREANFV